MDKPSIDTAGHERNVDSQADEPQAVHSRSKSFSCFNLYGVSYNKPQTYFYGNSPIFKLERIRTYWYFCNINKWKFH